MRQHSPQLRVEGRQYKDSTTGALIRESIYCQAVGQIIEERLSIPPRVRDALEMLDEIQYCAQKSAEVLKRYGNIGLHREAFIVALDDLNAALELIGDIIIQSRKSESGG